MLVLGIESSCDETAAAVVEDGRTILSNVIATQYDVHTKYGGIVPELASRRHVENIPVVIGEALNNAKVNLGDIDIFAVTKGPGLLGALLVGLSTAKGLAWAEKKPLVPVHHIHGHILAAGIGKDLEFPFLSLVVSGGHTSLYLVETETTISEISSTRDDAAGEAFDKAAKMLGLGFPGGPAIEREAKKGDAKSFPFTLPQVKNDRLAFSFSGLKTAVRNVTQKTPDAKVCDVAASFQSTAVDLLVQKTLMAADQFGLRRIVLAGGVACNSLLREQMQKEVLAKGYSVIWPAPILCTDNGAMIATAGYYLYKANPANPIFTDFNSLDAEANLPLTF